MQQPNAEATKPYKYLVKVVVVGDLGVEKSELTPAWTNKNMELTPKYEHELGMKFAWHFLEINGEGVKLQIWDTLGKPELLRLTQAYYREAKFFIFAWNPEQLNQVGGSDRVVAILDAMVKQTGKEVPVILVRKKSDKDDPEKAEDITAKEAQLKTLVERKGFVNVFTVTTSVKMHQGFDLLDGCIKTFFEKNPDALQYKFSEPGSNVRQIFDDEEKMMVEESMGTAEQAKKIVRCTAVNIPEHKGALLDLCTSTDEFEVRIKFISEFSAATKRLLAKRDLIMVIWNPNDLEANKEPLFQLEQECDLIHRQNGVLVPYSPIVFVCIGDTTLDQSRQVVEFATQQNIKPELYSVVATPTDFEDALRKHWKPHDPENRVSEEEGSLSPEEALEAREEKEEEESRFVRIAHSRKARMKNIVACLESEEVDEDWLLLMFDTTERGKRTSLLIEQYFAETYHKYVPDPKVKYQDSEWYKQNICFNALQQRKRYDDLAPVYEVLKLLDENERTVPFKIVMFFYPGASYIATKERERQVILDVAYNMYRYITTAIENGAPVVREDIYGKYSDQDVPDKVKAIAGQVFKWSKDNFEAPSNTPSDVEFR